MSKRYFLAIANVAILLPLTLFAWDRYLLTEQYFEKYKIEFGASEIWKATNHSIFFFFLGLLSLFGVLFWPQKKITFFISILYAASVLFLLFFMQSLSFWNITIILGELVFLWLLVWENTLLVFENRIGLKLISLVLGFALYLLLRKLFFVGTMW